MKNKLQGNLLGGRGWVKTRLFVKTVPVSLL